MMQLFVLFLQIEKFVAIYVQFEEERSSIYFKDILTGKKQQKNLKTIKSLIIIKQLVRHCRDANYRNRFVMLLYLSQFVIFNPWKVPWNWIAFSQNSFVISPDWMRQWTTCKQGLYVKSYSFFKTIVKRFKNYKLIFTQVKFSDVLPSHNRGVFRIQPNKYDEGF